MLVAGEPGHDLAKLFVAVPRVMTLVAVQSPVDELGCERRPNERIDRMYELELTAQPQYYLIGPRAAAPTAGERLAGAR